MVDNLTICIPFYNGHAYIKRLVDSLPDDIPILIVDDQSNVPLQRNLVYRPSKQVQVVRPTKKLYFAGAVNYAMEHTQTDLLVLNQDTWFDNDDWRILVDQHRNRFAFIGERIAGNHPSFGDLGYIHGTFMFLRRDAIECVGPFNSRLYPLWGNTAEWQWRLYRNGFEALPLREISGFHHERTKTERFGSSIQTLLKEEPDRQGILVRTPPLVSVVVPCYNYGRYVADCVNSLIGGPTSLGKMPGQTLQSFEIIIVNDASTDNSKQLIDEVAQIEKGIRAYHLAQNVGTAQALNFGIQRATGKYITFLSADDMREPDSLEKLVQCCEENPHSFAYDDIWIFYRHQRIKKWRMEEYDFDKLIFKNQIHAGIVFPKVAWEEVGGYPAIMDDGREDWAFNVALGIKGWCGVHVREYGYLYRREGQNRTETNTTPLHRERFLGKIQSLFPEIYRGQKPMACCGKGNNKKRTNVVTAAPSLSLASTNGARMATNTVGSTGMVKLQYTGKKMSSIWTGFATNAEYVFGVDRTTGWVDKRDVGERGKNGFLNSKDTNNQWLFQVVSDSKTVTPEVDVQTVVVDSEVASVTVETEPKSEQVLVLDSDVASLTVETEVGTSEAKATLSSSVPNPTDMTVEEVKRLDLDQAGWTEVYRIELANRSRKGLIAFLEETLASFA